MATPPGQFNPFDKKSQEELFARILAGKQPIAGTPLSRQQQEQVTDLGLESYAPLEAAMKSTSPTWGTALAKTAASGYLAHKGKKKAAEETAALTKTLQGEADETASADAWQRDLDTFKALPNSVREQMMGYEDPADVPDLDAETFWDPNKEGDTLRLVFDKKSQKVFNADTLKPYEGNVSSLVPYRAPATGSVQKLREAEEDAAAVLPTETRKASQVSQILGADKDVWEASTGRGDPRTLIAEWLPYDLLSEDDPMFDEKVQVQRKGLNNIAITAAAPILEILGPKPTDFDAKLALTAVPTPDDEPEVVANWVENELAPLTRDTLIANGKPEEGQRIYDEYIKAVKDMRATVYPTTAEGTPDFDNMTDQQLEEYLAK